MSAKISVKSNSPRFVTPKRQENETSHFSSFISAEIKRFYELSSILCSHKYFTEISGKFHIAQVFTTTFENDENFAEVAKFSLPEKLGKIFELFISRTLLTITSQMRIFRETFYFVLSKFISLTDLPLVSILDFETWQRKTFVGKVVRPEKLISFIFQGVLIQLFTKRVLFK